MPLVVLTTRVPKVLGADVGICIVPILEMEGYNGHLVTGVDPKTPAANRLQPGDRILQTNGVVCDNMSRLMNGIMHKYRIHTVDFMVLRHYVQPDLELEVSIRKAVVPTIGLAETDASLTWAPVDTGLEKGDLVLSVDGTAFKTGPEIRAALLADGPDPRRLKIARGRLLPSAAALLDSRDPAADYFVAHFNCRLNPARPLGLFAKDAEGKVFVCKADGGTLAGDLVLALDRIVAVNGQKVGSVAECAALIGKADGLFWLLVERSLCVATLVHYNKALWPGLGAKAEWAVPTLSPDLPDILARRQKSQESVAKVALRSISRDTFGARKVSTETVCRKPSILDEVTEDTLSASMSEEDLALKSRCKLGVKFKDAIAEVSEVFMDVVPKKKRRI